MSSSEPRLTAPEGDAAPDSRSANAGGNGSSPALHGSVLVADSVEQALAAVQVQLARQAATTLQPAISPTPILAPVPVPVPVPAPAPAPPPPVVLAPPPAPPPPVRESPRVRERPRRVHRLDDEDIEDDESEFWGETRRRRSAEVVVDPDTLTSAERRSLGRLKARKVRRILRHVSPWSVFKVSIFFNLCLWLIMMIAGVVLWRVAQLTPVLDNIEKFYAKATGEKTFQLDGRAIFRAAAGAGVILVLSGTAFIVLMSILFNLIADLTGGIRLSVIELEAARRNVRRGRGGEELRARARATRVDASDDADDVHEDVGDASDAEAADKGPHERLLVAGRNVPRRTIAASSDDATTELKVLTGAGPDDAVGDDSH